MEVDAILPSPFCFSIIWISLDVTKGSDHIAYLDVEDIDEDVELFVAIGTKMNP